jgi:hypothetical protein
MVLYKFLFCTLIISLVSCKSPTLKVVQPKNDTTKILELAIRTAFYHESLPSCDRLKDDYRFKDSILFTTDSLPLESLPISIDTMKFKILPKDQICLMIRADSNMEQVPNYLCIRTFEKNDTGYYLSIQSLSCLSFGGGGGIGMHIIQEGDSFIVKDRTTFSIN